MEFPCFHLSIPALDLDATERWYVDGLGCRRGRRSEHALIMDLGGHQLVAQRCVPASGVTAQQGIYPRHFGLIFAQLPDWEGLRDRARSAALRFAVEPRCRFAGQVLEHHTFFLIDPALNWLEFKHYSQPEAILGCTAETVVGDDAWRS